MEEIDLNEIGIIKKINILKPFIILKNEFCYEDPRGFIVDCNRKKRCDLLYLPQKIIGGHGILYFVLRNNEKILVKSSKIKEDSIVIEAIIQYCAYKILQKYHLDFIVPRIYEIFYKENSFYFSMEYLEAKTLDSFLLETKTPENSFLFCLLQICIILNILENRLYFNHRDLRITNILVLDKPTNYIFNYKNKNYKIDTTFHISIIDFGFACIGKEKTVINANETLFNNTTKCLKHGRDIFNLFISVWCIKEIRHRMNEEFIKTINNILIDNNYPYSELSKWSYYVKQLEDSKWTYNFTGANDFNMDYLRPINLIQKLIDLLNLKEI